MITGTIVLNLRRDLETADRRAVGSLHGLPAGMRVILEVGDRTFVPLVAADWLGQHVDRVHFDVHGSARAVRAWVEALTQPRSGARWSA